ncbi:MAG: 2-dehydro-3-deoxy-6-phosphogalactonate aldolase [Betaproteobacteria bacterium]|nr:2-dehydro-3-deoxy-6-phosphogalactonate aldolase [Betaproteobacteria bacterium]MCC7215195.1 2-dehydro-3-deoxy-6-phosphogalactonate aldolase [Burkholderiales bacterium]
MTSLASYLDPLPLIAVLRGITPEEIPGVADALAGAGFRVLEVPLNSPRAFASIRLLADGWGTRCLVGAGTVIEVDDVARVQDAGGRVIVMPHADAAVVRAAKARQMLCVPGVATPTEAFAALAAGADGLKMFPAEALPPAALRAWRAVLPPATLVFAVGGMKPDNLRPYWEAGASGFGTGSNLYRPGTAPAAVREVAGAYAAAVRALPAR